MSAAYVKNVSLMSDTGDYPGQEHRISEKPTILTASSTKGLASAIFSVALETCKYVFNSTSARHTDLVNHLYAAVIYKAFLHSNLKIDSKAFI